MTAEENYLAWLRTALWGKSGHCEQPERDSGLDPESLSAMLAIADRQTTRGLIFDALLRSSESLTAEMKARMREFLLQNVIPHEMLDATIARAVKVLQGAGIPSVLLKGQSMARNYPNNLLRECGDIDLYIGPEHFQEAMRVLSAIADHVDAKKTEKHRELWFGEAEIELHQYSVLPKTRRQERFYRALEAEGLGRNLLPLNFGGVQVNTPEPTFNAFYLFYHAWIHFQESGLGFRQLCDWTLYLHAHRERIDRERLRAILDGMRLLVPWQLFGCIAVHDLGLPKEEFPGYDEARLEKSRRTRAMILSEGNFGRYAPTRTQRPNGYVTGKLHTFLGFIRRLGQLWAFCPHEAWQNFVYLSAEGIRGVYKDLTKR